MMTVVSSSPFTIDDDDDDCEDNMAAGAIAMVDSVVVPKLQDQEEKASGKEEESQPVQQRQSLPTVVTPTTIHQAKTPLTGLVSPSSPEVTTGGLMAVVTPPSSPHATSPTVKRDNDKVVYPNLTCHPEVLELKIRRKRRTVVLGVVGGVVGTLLAGPIGGIAIGAAASICTKAAGKRKEIDKMQQIKKHCDVERATDRAEYEAQRKEQQQQEHQRRGQQEGQQQQQQQQQPFGHASNDDDISTVTSATSSDHSERNQGTLSTIES